MTPASAEHLIQKIRDIKSGHPLDFRLPILSNDGSWIGALVPITAQRCEQPEVVQCLTKWRRMFMEHFLTQFTATEQRTANWLKELVLQSNDRLLFLILEAAGSAVGNMGVCNLTVDNAELDNVIRGERSGHPRLAYFAEIALLSWLFFRLGLNYVYLHVFSNNSKAIRHYKSVGFVKTEQLRLTKTHNSDGVRYVANFDSGTPAPFSYTRMIINRSRFEEAHTWAKAYYLPRYQPGGTT